MLDKLNFPSPSLLKGGQLMTLSQGHDAGEVEAMGPVQQKRSEVVIRTIVLFLFHQQQKYLSSNDRFRLEWISASRST
jgi:hypothetical protein